MIRQMLDSLRWKVFFLQGAEDEPEVDETDETPETEESPETREVTAKELESMTARAAERASRKRQKELASEYGFDSWGKFKEWIETQQQAQQEAQSEQERQLAEAEKTRKDYEAKAAELARKNLELQVQTAVVGAGITDKKRIDRIAALVQMGLDPDILEEEDAWEQAITSALQEVRDDVPELFAKAGGSPGSGDGGAHGPSTPPGNEEAERQKQIEDRYRSRGLVSYPN